MKIIVKFLQRYRMKDVNDKNIIVIFMCLFISVSIYYKIYFVIVCNLNVDFD